MAGSLRWRRCWLSCAPLKERRHPFGQSVEPDRQLVQVRQCRFVVHLVHHDEGASRDPAAAGSPGRGFQSSAALMRSWSRRAWP